MAHQFFSLHTVNSRFCVNAESSQKEFKRIKRNQIWGRGGLKEYLQCRLLLLQVGNWGPERERGLPKTTQLGRGRSWIETHDSCCPSVPICGAPLLPQTQDNCQHLVWVRKTTALKGGNRALPSRQASCLWDKAPTKQLLCFTLREFTGNWYSHI